MSQSHLLPPPSALLSRPLVRELALGFGYWLAFMLVLEPSEVGHRLLTGGQVPWDQETMRLAGGAALGALSTPSILALVRRFPIGGARPWRNTALHLAAATATSALLIAASCVLVAAFTDIDPRPLAVALPEELVGSLLLLTANIGIFVGLAHTAQFAARGARPAAAPPRNPIARLPVRTRSGVVMVEMSAVDWIETQGNYLALHVGAQAHLVRETAARFEARLDPERFIRIHRRAIAAVDRIRELRPLPSGDALARLDSGAEVRVSRSYRESLQVMLRAARASRSRLSSG